MTTEAAGALRSIVQGYRTRNAHGNRGVLRASPMCLAIGQSACWPSHSLRVIVIGARSRRQKLRCDPSDPGVVQNDAIIVEDDIRAKPDVEALEPHHARVWFPTDKCVPLARRVDSQIRD